MSTGAPTGYAIARFTGRCAATGQPIEPGEAYVAALLESAPDGPLERRDYRVEAWEHSARPAGLFACWRAKRREKEDRPAPLIEDAELLNLFESLEGASSDRQAAFRYALGLLLLRRRLLRQVGTRRVKDEEALLLKRRGATADEAPLELHRPALDADACAALLEELGALTRGEA